MNIALYEQDITPPLWALLLSADPNRDAVSGYLRGAQVLVCEEAQQPVGIAVLVEEAGVHELKNIAVHDDYQGRGIAKVLIERIKELAKASGAHVLEVGTGNSSLSQLALYQKCGFRMHRIEHGFFESYPEPIIENGLRCLDMVRLRADLV